MSVEKIDEIIKEFNTLKLLVIKNQTIALETSSDMIKIKDEFRMNNEKYSQLNNKVDSINNRPNVEESNSQMLLRSLMSSNIFGAMKNQNYEDDDDSVENIDSNDKLNLNLENDEMFLDETQLAELLDIIKMDQMNIKYINVK